MITPNASTPGYAHLDVQVVAGQSAIVSARAFSPMKLLTPRARGRSVWAYTSSFGGGLLAGDETQLDLRIGPSARCFIGSQSSTKVYRNPGGRRCGHRTRAVIEPGSLLVFAPDAVQAFAGATYTQRQVFQLAPDAGLVLVDWFTSGRAACGERWAFNQFQSRNEVRLLPDAPSLTSSNGREMSPPTPIFLDALRLDSTECAVHAIHRTGRFHCFALLLLLGAPVHDAARQLLDRMSNHPVEPDQTLLMTVSPVAQGAVLRIAGEQMETVAHELHRSLNLLEDELGDDPWIRNENLKSQISNLKS
jgi:urease accessory protein